MPLAALLPFVSTLLGGLAALRFHHRLHPFMAFASGVLVATAIADLLPEAQELVGEDRQFEVAIAAVIGYLVFTLIESFIHQQSFEHGHDHAEHGDGDASTLTTAHVHRHAGGTERPARGFLGIVPP